VTHKLDKKNELNLIGLGAIDNFTFKRPKNPTLEQLAILEQIPLNTQRTNTTGITWRHTTSKGYWLLALSNSRLVNTADQYKDNEKPVEAEKILRYRSVEDETRLRYEWNHNINGWQLSAGIVGLLEQYSNATFQRRPGYIANYETEINYLRYGAFFKAGKK
jgi:hypothetical protein